MVKSRKSGKELGGERGDKAPSWLRRVLGHTEEKRSDRSNRSSDDDVVVRAPVETGDSPSDDDSS